LVKALLIMSKTLQGTVFGTMRCCILEIVGYLTLSTRLGSSGLLLNISRKPSIGIGSLIGIRDLLIDMKGFLGNPAGILSFCALQGPTLSLPPVFGQVVCVRQAKMSVIVGLIKANQTGGPQVV
jgi:hypothetical protein